MWTQIFSYPKRKSCGFRNIRIRVDGALLYVNEGLVTILHSFTFLISNFCHIYRVKIFKFTVQFPIPCLELFLCRTCALIYLFSNALVNTSQTSSLPSYRTSVKSSMTKYALAVNFAVLFENISSTTINHTFFLVTEAHGSLIILLIWNKNLKF